VTARTQTQWSIYVTTFKDKTAIVGYGATEFSKNSGRSELQLSIEATLAAFTDVGIDPTEVDGLVTYTVDNNSEFEIFRNIGGRELKFFSRISAGGGAACAPLQQAALAIAAGVAQVVVCYRAMNERSEYRFGAPRLLQMRHPFRYARKQHRRWTCLSASALPKAGLQRSNSTCKARRVALT
jgi:acetyl-CoA acetyltransferase